MAAERMYELAQEALEGLEHITQRIDGRWYIGKTNILDVIGAGIEKEPSYYEEYDYGEYGGVEGEPDEVSLFERWLKKVAFESLLGVDISDLSAKKHKPKKVKY